MSAAIALAAPSASPSVGRRLRRGLAALAYCAVSLVFGAVSLTVAMLVMLAAAFAVTGIRRPLLAFAAVGRVLGRADRRMANQLLNAKIPPPTMPLLDAEGVTRHGGAALVRNPRAWKLILNLAVRFVVAWVVLAVTIGAVVVVATLLVLGFEGVFGVGEAEVAGPFSLTAPVGVLLLALAFPVTVLGIAGLDGAHLLLRAFMRRMFLPPASAAAGPVREMLAQSLGDHSLSIAYFLPDRGGYVDEAGRPVVLPDPRSGRAWTAVDRDGRRVAAILHDAALDASPELVQAAAAAASLAIDNERLKADLRARVEELRVSRMRIVEASDAARRRLERDLHDGAQQQLVSLALDLRLLKARLKGHEAGEHVDAVAAKLQQALSELRELARGIHPAILTQQGLGPALEALAARCRTPVELDVAVDPQDRPPAAIEAAAYFTVSEALANVGKYAEASLVRIGVHRREDHLEVVVEDDGRGGADPAAGSGLRGLEDRVAALDGTLEIASPPGAGTRLVARIPIGG